MFDVKLYLPKGGKRELTMPAIPRTGDTIYYTDSEGLGCIGEDRRLRVTNVSWQGQEAKVNEPWSISIDTEFADLDE